MASSIEVNCPREHAVAGGITLSKEQFGELQICRRDISEIEVEDTWSDGDRGILTVTKTEQIDRCSILTLTRYSRRVDSPDTKRASVSGLSEQY